MRVVEAGFCSPREGKGRSKIKLAILCYTPGTLMLEVYPWN
jgi:hypothetical protein